MSTRIPHLDVGGGRQRGALTLFPVWVDQPSVRGLEWATTALEVGELSDQPRVGQLDVRNPGPRPAVLLEGDLLAGGLQHRMAAASTLLVPGERTPVGVLCVEHGRWSGHGAHRGAGRRATYTSRQANLAEGDERAMAQEAVWSRVGRYDEAFGRSATSSLLDHLDRVDEEPIRRMSGQRGVIVGIGGRVVGIELFGSSRGLAARWDGLVRAAQLDARLVPPVATPAQAARDLVRALGRAALRDGGAAGAACSVRSDGSRLQVSGVRSELDEARPLLHLTAFDTTHPLLAAA